MLLKAEKEDKKNLAAAISLLEQRIRAKAIKVLGLFLFKNIL